MNFSKIAGSVTKMRCDIFSHCVQSCTVSSYFGKTRTAFSLPHPAVSGCHHEAAAGFHRVNSQLCFLLSRYICPLMCVYHIYHEAVTTSGQMTTSGKELTLLVLHCTPPPTPLLPSPPLLCADHNLWEQSERHV